MCAVPTLVLLLLTAGVGAESTSTGQVLVTATFESRTALVVSAENLAFRLDPGTGEATASVDFLASARTRAGGEVVLTVTAEALPDAVGDDLALVTFTGEAPGLSAVELTVGRPAVAGRWTGSGRRSGRLVFTLTDAPPGLSSVPVRFVLSAP